MLELLNSDDHTYTIRVEEPEDALQTTVILISDGRHICFHLAVSQNNADIDDAKAVCAQAVLYRSTPYNASLYFAVYNTSTQLVHFCSLDPAAQTYKDTKKYSMRSETSEAEARLQAFVASNSRVLQ